MGSTIRDVDETEPPPKGALPIKNEAGFPLPRLLRDLGRIRLSNLNTADFTVLVIIAFVATFVVVLVSLAT